ncbi:DUF885 domain-containing protein [Oleiharenicola lentus]|jgi:uncharacterized protein (DUF885 family)|uniref:DUF885 domain-containing protein n=1 Tax=Oleiharenicola lentus TaxID=2508720 RepID=A0A4Q1CBX4_9BACT|nr:DUF885 domain-containing protein [Oleiharenicola lentus]RXK56604.1 DUF885 domain-containing protein [Oleiharenicola lentus]
MQGKLRFFAALVVGAVSFVSGRGDEFAARYQAVIDAKGKAPEAERLHALFQADWAYTMAVYPEYATWVGYAGHEREWTDLSREAIARRREVAGRALPALATIDRTQLGPVDRVSYDIFKRQAEESVEGNRFPSELEQINQLGGIHQDATQLLRGMSAANAGHFENQLARLQALPQVVDNVISLLEEGLAKGITPPQITLREVPTQILNQIPEEPLKSPLLATFVDLPPAVSGERGLELRAAAAKTYTIEVRPAFQRLEKFVREKYIPGARQTIAATDLPDGRAWYALRIKTYTSTDLTAQQIHDIGLAEVKRIRAEMERVKTQVGFKGTLPEFFVFLRTDPQFYFTDKEDLLRAYRDIAKRADPQMIKLFKTLPRTPYGILPVPAYAEKSQTTAYYYPGAPETGRPGYFFANTYALHTRPKWEMEALTLHEAVPGHHHQIALAQEMDALPEFRRHGGYTAFVEGWGLYSESLGEEMGFYTDPYAKFGQLTYEMWRAVRLVVDTGMHALGWSRQQAIDYFKDNAGKSEHDIVVEIDRYIVWPGQALAYKLGELKIKELRAHAEKELGAKFDIRLFHDEVLRNGAVPLTVLETHIREWVAAQKAAAPVAG